MSKINDTAFFDPITWELMQKRKQGLKVTRADILKEREAANEKDKKEKKDQANNKGDHRNKEGMVDIPLTEVSKKN